MTSLNQFLMRSTLCVSLLIASAAMGAELRMNWAGHDSDGVLDVDLGVGDQATIELRISLQDGDTLSGAFFFNGAQPDISQVASAAAPANWSAGTQANGPLGGGAQQFSVGANSPLQGSLIGPGEFLLGSQTIELVDGTPGDELEIVFALAQLGVIDESGQFYALTASGSQFEDEVGFVHLGVGSPGYTRNMTMDIREPLIVRVAQGSTGGGGGGGGGGSGGNGNDNSAGNGNTNDNTNANDNGSGNDNSNGNQNSNANSNDNGNGNDNSAGNGNQNANDNGNSNGNANDNGSGNDNSNGNQNANDNGGGNGNSNSGNGNSNGNDQPRGLCGLGMVSMLPLNLLGLLALRRRRRGGF